MDFTAIDFETASHRRDSACQLAAVRVRGGEIVDSAVWMIRPRPLFFTRSNIRIHGITPDRVEAEPEFGELWPRISAQLGDDCLVAHNARFDLGVMLACLRSHGRPVPTMQFTCTRAIARRAWPGRRSYGLKPLADWLGIRFRHHDALEDAVACAKVLGAAAVGQQADTLDSLEQTLRLPRGAAGSWGIRSPSSNDRGRRGRSAARARGGGPDRTLRLAADGSGGTAEESGAVEPAVDLQRIFVRAELIRPLTGKTVVFTGQLRSLSREIAEELARRSGGCCGGSVTKSTDLVVVGDSDHRTASAGRVLSVKEERARKLQDEGRPIRIVGEDEFFGLIVADPVAAASNRTEREAPTGDGLQGK